MNAHPDDLTVKDVIDLKLQQMLVVNSEYQRGAVWTTPQKKKLIDSVMRGYPIPLMYFHHIRQQAGPLVSERYEVIDGQQRVNALSDFFEGAFKLFDPVKDEREARFPDFIKHEPCPWGERAYDELPKELQDKFLQTPLQIVKIETHNPNEARDLFVRLQAGMPLNSQEKRDAWPGEFTDFDLKLGGKSGVAKYPGHEFFNIVMRAQKVADRGKFRQLAAQIAMLYFTRRNKGQDAFCDTNAKAIDDFYYENLGFDPQSVDAKRLFEIFDKATQLLRDQKRPKVIGHEAIHLILFIDTIWDDYTRSWEDHFASAFDHFRAELAASKATQGDVTPGEYWLRYGVLTRVNSDRADTIQRRHEFFSLKMRESLQLQPKDPTRLFGLLERELIYYRDKKHCAVCGGEVVWSEAEIHHVNEHAKGGQTLLDNGVLVHKHCHPKGQAAVDFAAKWKEQNAKTVASPNEATSTKVIDGVEEDEDDV